MSVSVVLRKISVILYQQESWVFEKCIALKLHKLLDGKKESLDSGIEYIS